MTERITVYANAATIRLIDQHSGTQGTQGGNRSGWIAVALERYLAVIHGEKPGLKRLFTHAQAQEIINATLDRLLDPVNVTSYVIASTKDAHLAELMRNISASQRAVLCECCDQYHRRARAGEDVQPTLNELFA
jgi:hypothetical protein